ncbi:MAG: pyridoxal phosphate-dependent aminotransferase [Myxococcota bacterium]
MPRFPAVSPVVESLSAGVFSELVKRAHAMEGPVYPLHVGDTYRDPLPAARAENQTSTAGDRLHNYAPVQGMPELLNAIVERLKARTGHAIDRSNLQVMPGATAGLSVVANVLLDAGDEVILPSPYWPLIRGIIAARGARPVEVPMFDRLGDEDDDPERAVAEAINDRTVALYLNSPNNPTGAVLPPELVTRLLRLAKKHDLWLICDEAYEELWFTEQRPDPIWAHPLAQDRVLATHTLSKSYGLAGARVGFTHGPSSVMRAVRGAQTFKTYCASRPMQLAAAQALRLGDGWLDEARSEYRRAAERSAALLGIAPPAGGTFVFFDARPHYRSGEHLFAFLERCLEAGVLLTPGSASGAAYQDWVRLCFTSVTPEDLEDALERLRPLLSSSS